MFSPLSRSWFAIAGGVSPFGIIQAISPLFMSYAVMRPYGGLSRRNPPSCGAPPLIV
jgi:hypothetical protein